MSNLYIAVSAMLFCLSGQVVLGGKISSWPLAMLVFFATWCMYQGSRYLYHRRYEPGKQVHDNLYQWQEVHPGFTRLSIWAGAVGALFFAFFLRFETLLVLAAAAGVSVLYALPGGLRQIPFAKIVFIAIIWAVTGVFLPAAESGLPLWESPVWPYFLFQMGFILFVTIPFDMSDMKADKAAGVFTLPMALGFHASKWLMMFLGVLLAVFVHLFLRKNGILNDGQSAASVLMISLLVLRTAFLSADPPKWKIMLVYDGAIMVYALLLMLLK